MGAKEKQYVKYSLDMLELCNQHEKDPITLMEKHAEGRKHLKSWSIHRSMTTNAPVPKDRRSYSMHSLQKFLEVRRLPPLLVPFSFPHYFYFLLVRLAREAGRFTDEFV